MNLKARVTLLIAAGLVFLTIGITCLVPIAFIGDPAEGAYNAQRLIVATFLVLSFVFGSTAMMLFIRAVRSTRSNINAPRPQSLKRGAGLIIGAILLFWLSFVEVRSSLLLLSFPLTVLMLYLGGGFLLTSVDRLPKP